MALEEGKAAAARTDWPRRIAIGMAGLGLIDSLYLTVVKLANATAICSGIGDCETVNSSRYSEIGGIPIAVLGAGAYLAILLLLLWEPNLRFNRDYARLAVFGISLSGTLYSAYLTYVEVQILRAICPFCVVSAVLMTGIFAISVTRLSG